MNRPILWTIIASFTCAAAPAFAQITGTVKFAGKPPKREAMAAVNAVPQCKHANPLLDETVIVDQNGGLANVVVYLKGANVRGPVPNAAVVLDQVECQFVPHVAAMMVGQDLRAKNSDSFLHNVHSLSQNNPQFNNAQPNRDAGVLLPRVQVAETFEIKCDVHPWMHAWVVALDHPYFAVTDVNGDYSIDTRGLKDGAYVIEAWHEKFKQSPPRPVVVRNKMAAGINFQFGQAPVVAQGAAAPQPLLAAAPAANRNGPVVIALQQLDLAAPTTVKTLVEVIERDKEAVTRAYALKLLSEIGPPAAKQAHDAVYARLRDADYLVREEALRCLENLEPAMDHTVAQAIVAMGHNSALDHFRAAKVLADHLDERGVVAALADAVNDPDSDVRDRILAVLEDVKKLPPETALKLADAMRKPDFLAEGSHGQNQSDVRTFHLLLRMGPAAKEAAPALANMLIDPFRRDAAEQALVSIGPPAAAALRESLHSDDVQLRAASARALGMIVPWPNETVPALLEALKDPHASVRLAAVDSLTSTSAKPAAGAVRAAMSDSDPAVRAAAVRAVAVIGPGAGPERLDVPNLTRRLGRDDNATRFNIAWLLSLIGVDASSAAPALERLVDNDEPFIRQIAARALASVDPNAELAPNALFYAVVHHDVESRRLLLACAMRSPKRPEIADRLMLIAADNADAAAARSELLR